MDRNIPVPAGWIRLCASSTILLTDSMDSKRTYRPSETIFRLHNNNDDCNKRLTKIYETHTFHSGLPISFKRLGVIFALISSRGSPSDPEAEIDDPESKAFIVFLGAAAEPCQLT